MSPGSALKEFRRVAKKQSRRASLEKKAASVGAPAPTKRRRMTTREREAVLRALQASPAASAPLSSYLGLRRSAPLSSYLGLSESVCSTVPDPHNDDVAVAIAFEEMPAGFSTRAGAGRDYLPGGSPLQPCMVPSMLALHVMQLSPKQLYDVKRLHNCPHYSLTRAEVEAVTAAAAGLLIDVIVYEDCRNYLDPHAFLRVVNDFEAASTYANSFATVDMAGIAAAMDGGPPLAVSTRGNRTVNVGCCSQVYLPTLTAHDRNYAGFEGLNRPHLT